MSKKSKLIGFWFREHDEDGSIKSVSQVIGEPLQNVLMTTKTNLKTFETSLVTRAAGSLDAVTWYGDEESAMKGFGEDGNVL
jgi:hypothetical protein